MLTLLAWLARRQHVVQYLVVLFHAADGAWEL
jgi:hypothetical protein